MEPPPLVDAALSVALWDDCLRQLTPVVHDKSDDPDLRWLDSAQLLDRTATPETWRRVGEALDVLSLIARNDLLAWRLECLRLWPALAAAWGERSIVLDVGLVIRITHKDVLTALGERVLDVERLRRYYCEARERVKRANVLGANRLDFLSKYRPRIPLRLDFNFMLENAHALSKALRQTLQIVACQKQTPTVHDDGDYT